MLLEPTLIKQAVGGRPHDMPPPLYAACSVQGRPSSSPYTPYVWPAAPSAPCFQ